uniref:Calcium-independent phospholipase A2-gamma-like n=2 Tax=Paramormyrops kingsleyae TaxID=1676925 RepID=A0A3B3SQL6_9TELE|nr:calcium-independent phospholipase A2-gamma-like isoform X1 [Paramormyrops kingsleyae]XP_023671770.1 calcium-independent phospholipase A2-gamma-like isoform X1 [Paramormyrops kingsleyae]
MTVRWLVSVSVFAVSRAANAGPVSVQFPALHSISVRPHGKRPFSGKSTHCRWSPSPSRRAEGIHGWSSSGRLPGLRLCLRGPISRLTSSAARGLTSLRQRMSRVRSALDSVSKAVTGTPAKLLSKIGRLKPGIALAGKGVPLKPEAIHKQPESKSDTRKGAKDQTDSDRAAQQGVQPSQANYFSANLDETYDSLASHVNAYFGSGAAVQDGQASRGNSDPSRSHVTDACPIPALVPVSDSRTSKLAPTSSSPLPAAPPLTLESSASLRRGIGQYLSYPVPSVQALLGSYFAALVPRLRSEPKVMMGEKDKPPAAEDAASEQQEVTEDEGQKAADDKAKQLLLQREKIIARVSVDNRTRALVQALQRASDVKLYIRRVEELSCHLLEFPETKGVAVKEKAVPCLLRLRQAGDPILQAAVRQALALVGYTDPVKGRGIRLLSIDGGGTRGLVALQTLHKLESLTGKRIHQLFDYICGVSTGAILAFMLGVFQIPLDECEEMYRRLGSDVFKQNVIVGTVKMSWSHAFYDSEVWESILRERMGSELMIKTARKQGCPKVAAVSTIVNRGTPLKAYVFRNYNLPSGVRSHYLGGCEHKLWQAIRASSAAPGYFQEFLLGNDLHQDGGLLINNPTALAIHECKCLWPNTPVQCVVSLGTGRFESASRNSATYTSLKTKLTNVISSATDTEGG